MKKEISARMLGVYDGADLIATKIMILLYEARNKGRDTESVCEQIRQAQKQWHEERNVWQKRHEKPEEWSGYAEKPQPTFAITDSK